MNDDAILAVFPAKRALFARAQDVYDKDLGATP